MEKGESKKRGCSTQALVHGDGRSPQGGGLHTWLQEFGHLLLQAVLEHVVMDNSGMGGRGRWLVCVESMARGRPGGLLGEVAAASGWGAGSGARWELARGRPRHLLGDVVFKVSYIYFPLSTSITNHVTTMAKR
jgi:hypothetical protein